MSMIGYDMSIFFQLKLCSAGKMGPCDNVKIDWGLNAVRFNFCELFYMYYLLYYLKS